MKRQMIQYGERRDEKGSENTGWGEGGSREKKVHSGGMTQSDFKVDLNQVLMEEFLVFNLHMTSREVNGTSAAMIDGFNVLQGNLFNIWHMWSSVNVDLVWASSIDATNTESTSHGPAVVLRCVSSEQGPSAEWFHVPFGPFPFLVTRH